ncbi:DUF4142 domain-containing protein [Novosphingobium sp. Leaf2]|uniref:DUF4142 domain-containing protein n=1 Tax=Novosphingobium sp. Leaf2 TaxID=1735670 RepID=UPI0006F3D017|nr:DUF4142 domain-containing protein [Novosphingobium sp. Leaf2]KQM20644.1 hypothetical protein ASE49_16765 [Novosphingobium sp. Leaf2]
MNKLIIAAGAFVLASSPAYAEPMTAQQYVAAAGAGDLYERESSKIVMGSTEDPRIRDFAQMMISNHTKSTAEVKAATAAARVKVAPARLKPEQAKMIAQLKAQQGKARDMTYLTQQKMAHQQALALHQDYARNGTARPLRDAAAAITPVVEQHIAKLQAL